MINNLLLQYHTALMRCQPNRGRSKYTTVGGGANNTATNANATVGGGQNNAASGLRSTVGGGFADTASATDATVGGGSLNTASGTNATVSGGSGNRASNQNATVGGGLHNTASGVNSTVSGGETNIASGFYSALSGGVLNIASDLAATVSGGGNNIANGRYTVIGGGNFNIASNDNSTVGGGYLNTANGNWSAVGGGSRNNASNQHATVGGGEFDTASGIYATVPGGKLNTAGGDFSFAAGKRAKADHIGSFVWGDAGNADVSSSLPNQFTARTTGGARFFSNGALTTGVNLPPGGGAWAAISDRNVKENIRPVNGADILVKLAKLNISRWNYETQDASIEHIGPMAQDFYRLFGLGDDDKTISTLDPDGIALAAIQELDRRTRHIGELTAQNQRLESEMTKLREMVEALMADK